MQSPIVRQWPAEGDAGEKAKIQSATEGQLNAVNPNR